MADKIISIQYVPLTTYEELKAENHRLRLEVDQLREFQNNTIIFNDRLKKIDSDNNILRQEISGIKNGKGNEYDEKLKKMETELNYNKEQIKKLDNIEKSIQELRYSENITKTKKIFENLIVGLQDINGMEQLSGKLNKDTLTNLTKYRSKNVANRFIDISESEEDKNDKMRAILIELSKDNKFINELFTKKIGRDLKPSMINFLQGKLPNDYDKIKTTEYMNELEEVF